MYFTEPKYPKLIPAMQKPIAIIKKTIGKLVSCKDFRITYFRLFLREYADQTPIIRLPARMREKTTVCGEAPSSYVSLARVVISPKEEAQLKTHR